ncbi:SipW-dependent-type signal peptide-containing protein [Promicromonospora sp. Populi]|uniref:SipW-dependent-type signal peptide-containing protein n=1 Tax=Promicromonospora sp. Populi TaxID=3239420 RepID=UPI0034E26FD5
MAEPDRPSPQRASSWSTTALRRGLVALALAMLLPGAVVAWAWWSDTATVTSDPITAGTLDLTVGPVTGSEQLAGPGGSWTYTALGLTGMLPGESVARTIVLRSSGTAGVDVSGTVTSTTTALGQHLLLSTTTGGAATNTTPGGLRTGACTGTVSRAQAPVTATATSALSAVPVASGSTVTLCVVLGLSPSAPSSVQGASTTATFVLTANQAGAP